MPSRYLGRARLGRMIFMIRICRCVFIEGPREVADVGATHRGDAATPRPPRHIQHPRLAFASGFLMTTLGPSPRIPESRSGEMATRPDVLFEKVDRRISKRT